MAVSAKGANGVATRAGGLCHRPGVVLVVVVAVVGAESGCISGQRLGRSNTDCRASQMTVRRLALLAVECSVVGRSLRRRVHRSSVVDRVVRASVDARNDSEMSSHAWALDC